MAVDWTLMGTFLIRIGIASVLGGLIGLERETANQTAGLRTHILISLGAALVMCTGEYLFRLYSQMTSIDPARLGAQVVSGIGILCAGTIMKEGTSTITGLTTATGLWCSACIGLAVSSGNTLPAVGATVITLVVLRLFRHAENRDKHRQKSIEVRLSVKDSEQVEKVTSWLKAQYWPVEVHRFERTAEDTVVLYCKFRQVNPHDRMKLVTCLSQIECICETVISEEETRL